LVLFSSAPLLLYTIFVTYVTLSLSGGNKLTDAGAEALAAVLKDSQLQKLYLSTLSSAAIFGVL
jgi:hypothetical protein